MTFVLFHLDSGAAIAEYDTESEALVSMRESNNLAGFNRRGMSFENGYESELVTNGRSPYAITEYQRWEEKFSR